MKVIVKFTNFACGLLASYSNAGAAPAELFVSPLGNDADAGSQANPFATIARGYATNSRPHQAVMHINPTPPPWSVRFPEMTNLLASHPELPLRTRFERNVKCCNPASRSP